MMTTHFARRIVATCGLFAWTLLAPAQVASQEGAARPLPDLPAPGTAWDIDAMIGGARIRLAMPEEASLIDRRYPRQADEIMARSGLRDANLATLHRLREAAAELMEEPRLEMDAITPLNELLIAVHPSDAASLPSPLHRHRPLLEALPAYTRLQVMAPQEAVSAIRRELATLGMAARSEVYPVPTWAKRESGIELTHATTRWAQDLGKLVRNATGRSWLLAPASHHQINDLTRADNRYLQRLNDDKRQVVFSPFFFRGGNIAVADSATHGRVLFIGERELVNNQADTYNATFYVPPREALKTFLARLTGADTVVVIPNSRRLFHLDMAFQFLGDGKVAIIDPVDPDRLEAADREMLTRARRALTQHGFTLVKLPTSTAHIALYSSPVNFLLYRDAESGQKTAILPRPVDTGELDPGSLQQGIAEALAQAGVSARFAQDRFHRRHGGFHCAGLILD